MPWKRKIKNLQKKDNIMSVTTLSQVLKQGKEELKRSDIPKYALDAEVILSGVLSATREYLFVHPEKELSVQDYNVFFANIKKRKQGIPLAYIIGYKQFYGFDFYVNKDVLIPRPETELIIDSIAEHKRNPSVFTKNTALLDMGTGSGCLVVTSALKFNALVKEYFAVDICQKALKISYKNANKHNVNHCIKFLHGNLMEPIFFNIKEFLCYENLIITANLPYLTEEQYKKAPSIWKEPSFALLGGEYGLDLYKDFIHQLKLFKTRTNLSLALFLEIDPDQKNRVTGIINSEFPGCLLDFKKDIRGKTKIAIVRL